MAPIFAARACALWEEGHCVHRIRAALLAVVEAAERNLIIGDRKDCRALRFGFPREMSAMDFRDKAVQLAMELTGSSRGTVTYPINQALSIEIRTSIYLLYEDFHQQMKFWGWGWPTELSDNSIDHLVTSISEHNLDDFRRCLTDLDEALARNPAPIPSQTPGQVEEALHSRSARPGIVTDKAYESHGGEGCNTNPSSARKNRSKRDQGKMAKCLGAYVEAIGRGEVPPRPSELAKLIGCDKSTASRAIRDIEERRVEMVRKDAAGRYRDSS